MNNHDKQWAVHAIMTELAAQSHNGDNQGSYSRDRSDNCRIERDRLAALLSAETTFVVYHPTFISQIKACWILFKTALRLKKRDGFVIIGRTSIGKENAPRDISAAIGLAVDKHL